MSDGLHGVRFVDATSFPTGIAMAASWNKDMMFDIGRAMGRNFTPTANTSNSVPLLICAATRAMDGVLRRAESILSCART